MKRFFTLSVCLFATASLFAWGLSGHRIIGEIAQSHLSRKAEKKIDAVLQGSTLAMEANWADFIKSDTTYRECSAWHYNNFAAGIDRPTFDSVAMLQGAGEAVYRIYYLIDHLKKNPDDANALRFLVHIVGDIHCPMHMGRPDDRGGNSIKLKWFGKSTNLHSLWDGTLIDAQKLSYTEYAAHLLRTQMIDYQKFEQSQVLDWAWQTVQNGNDIYTNVELASNGWQYMFRYKSLWENCLMNGGVHLAAILNYIYK